LAIAGNVAAQNAWRDDVDISSRPFWVNVLYFQDDKSEKTLTEVVIEVPYRSLAFQKIGEIYETNVEAGVVIDDAHGFQVDGRSLAEKIQTKNPRTTQSNRHTQIFYFAFYLQPENYTARVIIGDQQDNRRFSYTCALKPPSFRLSQPQISSLLLARQLEMSGGPAIMQKNGRSMIPQASHLFNADQPRGFVYFEAYNLAPIAATGDSFQVQCWVTQAGHTINAMGWRSPKPGDKAVISLPLNLSDVEPGEYSLLVKVTELNSNRVASAIAIFYLARPTPPFGSLPLEPWQNRFYFGNLFPLLAVKYFGHAQDNNFIF
jgi:hypothetical protein